MSAVCGEREYVSAGTKWHVHRRQERWTDERFIGENREFEEQYGSYDVDAEVFRWRNSISDFLQRRQQERQVTLTRARKCAQGRD